MSDKLLGITPEEASKYVKLLVMVFGGGGGYLASQDVVEAIDIVIAGAFALYGIISGYEGWKFKRGDK